HVATRYRSYKSFATAFALSPDGCTVATALPDTTILLWNLPGPSAEKPSPLTAGELEQTWTDLSSADARRAYLAHHRLASLPEQFLPLARGRLKPAKAPDRDEIKRLLVHLEDAAFQKRDAAARRLGQLGPE